VSLSLVGSERDDEKTSKLCNTLFHYDLMTEHLVRDVFRKGSKVLTTGLAFFAA